MDNIETVKLKNKEQPNSTQENEGPLQPYENYGLKSARDMIDKYHKKFFHSRNMYLGRLMDTTDRVLSNKNMMI